jgi:radical SAM superfamily enzyme YgiQ (UPF0313 family)
MADIVLSTLNAKFIHTSFGLRYLFANLGALQHRAVLAEFDLNQRPLDIAEAILRHQPRIVGFGVYIWNVTATNDVVSMLKRLRPDLVVILGGPEVSFETEQQPIAGLADHVITGEADLAFREVCAAVLAGQPPTARVMTAPLPELGQLALPYEFYTDADLAHRIVYVEASRGCPFRCEFCLSSLDVPVRQAPLPEFLAQMQRLLERGATHLKFVDRTFNLHLPTSRAILEFCLAQWRPGRFFHFELVPDRLPPQLREVIARFPPGALQFEVGIQTFNEAVAERIERRQDYARLEENLRWLRAETGVHLHADLIFGLPGESLESFAAGFDRLLALQPQEIQVGILKRLRGTPITRHDAEWEVIWNPQPPYEMLRNRLVDFATLQRMRRFARYWDLVGNSGNFLESAHLLWRGAASPFAAFLRWSDWLFAATGRTDSIALPRLSALLFEFLTRACGLPEAEARDALGRDYQRPGRRDLPTFLRPDAPTLATASRQVTALKRQARHAAQNRPG